MIVELTVEKGKDSFRILWYTGGIQRHNGKRCEKVTRAKRVLRVIGIILAVVAVLFVILLVFLTVAEYRPQPVEEVAVTGTSGAPIDGHVRVLTFNIGYAGLGKDQDFFMDGGGMVRPDSKADVGKNLSGIGSTLAGHPADVVFIQEADVGSHRSYYLDEAGYLADLTGKNAAFAYNYKAAFVPYPIPMIGKVEGGLLTLTDYGVESASRVALPVPFKWPVSTCNLKRCLLVCRVPYGGHELVLVNLHLEAYDGGEGKTAQTNMLMDFLTEEYEKGNYVIAGGDFNQTFPDIGGYPVVDAENWMPGVLSADMLPGGWQFAVDASSPTCRLLSGPYTGNREQTQLYVIDGFILSPNVALNSVHTLDLDFEYADHNPVMLDVELQ